MQKNPKLKIFLSDLTRAGLAAVGAVVFAATCASADTVGYWRLEDGRSGNDISSTADSSGNGLSAVQWSGNEVSAKFSDNVGGAYIYDPVSETMVANKLSMHAPASATTDESQILAAGAGSAISSGSFTFEMFIQILDNGNAAALNSGNPSRIVNIDGAGSPATLEIKSNFLEARVRGSGKLDVRNKDFTKDGFYAQDGDWHHVAYTVSYDARTDQTTVELFYDYESRGSATSVGATAGFIPEKDIRFGPSSTEDGDYDWYMDEARLSSGVLTSDQFLQYSSANP